MMTAVHSADEAPDRTPAALRRLGVTVLTLAVAVAATYGVPGLERFRPWVPGEPWPLASLFAKWGSEEDTVPAFAGAGSGYQAPSTDVRKKVAEQVSRTVASNLGRAAGVRTSARVSGGGSAPGRGSGGGGSPSARVEIAPSEYEEINVTIADPTGRGMRPFYEQLRRTARERDGALARIAHYGDSSIATDLITHTARRRLQQRFGDGGHGFILVARGSMPWGHRDVQHRANEEWRLRQIVRKSLGDDGRYGYGGVQYRGVPGARAAFGTAEDAPVGNAVSRFEIYYQQWPHGGKVRLRVDDGEPRKLDTRGEGVADAFEAIDVPDGPHELSMRVVSGRPRIYGVVLEREGPGVVYDSLGLVGARAKRLLNYHAEHIATQLEHRDVHLLILGFGGNEADAPLHHIEDYEKEFTRVIRHMKAGREDMGCLVFAPLDQAHKNERGRVVTMPTIPEIVEAQRKAAHGEGCAFYNTWEAMGGEGAMRDWYRARPRLAMGDFRHATPAGYEVIGNMLYKALLEGFARYLEEQREGAEEAGPPMSTP